MIVYVITTLISVFFAHFAEEYKKRAEVFFPQGNKGAQRLCFFLAFLPLFLVSAFRFEVGTDYAGTYRNQYYYVLQGSAISIRDFFYGFLNVIAQFFYGNDYTGVFLFSSLLFCGFVYMAIYEQSKNYKYNIILLVVTGFYFLSFNQVRQCIASAFFLYALKYIEKREPLKYFILISCAMGFHKIALFYFPIYFVPQHRKFRLSYIGITLLFVIMLQSLLTTWVRALVSLSVFSNFSWYFDSIYDTGEVHVQVLIEFIILVFFMYINAISRNKSILEQNLQFLAVFFYLLMAFVPLAHRLGRLFTIAQIISLPKAIVQIENEKERLLIYFLIFILFAAYTMIRILRGWNDVLPYKTIFFDR
jgi:hypothetical protein